MVEQNTRNFAKLKYNLQEKVGFDLTQQDGRKKRTAKRLSVTNVTGLLLACFVVIFIYSLTVFRGPFLESPGNFRARKDTFKSKCKEQERGYWLACYSVSFH